MKTAPLETRIAQALDGEASSESLCALVDEVTAAADDMATQAEALRAVALDPRSDAQAVRRARDGLDEARFRSERLDVARDRLTDALREAQAREAETARRNEYEAARRERDALAKDLATVYPEAAAKIADLLRRMVANDARLAAVNASRPAGADWLFDVEHIVRRVDQSGALVIEGAFPSQVGRLADKIVLPAIDPQAMRAARAFWNRAR